MNAKKDFGNVGIVWYTKEEWQKMKEISSDAEIFENSFKEWEQMANKSLVDMKASGIVAQKVFIKNDEFIVWCKIHSLPFDASSRSKDAVERM
ncbi:MAG: hypothetical protein FD188_3563 [Ignavibacteria bacterium]|nr:MAG: hypothetical protein FD188_3563 [Ignavibacteria bacterium]